MLSVALLVVTGTLAGYGAFATFTGTTSASQSLSSGTISLSPISTNGVNNRLSVGAANLAAGDTVQRTVDLKNTGTIALSGATLTTTASPSSLLDTDSTYGLQLAIDKCSVAWTESGPPYTYTCGGSTSTVVASVPVIGTNTALGNIVTTAGVDNYLRVTLTLPSNSPNTLQGQSSTILFNFAGTQRAAGAQ